MAISAAPHSTGLLTLGTAIAFHQKKSAHLARSRVTHVPLSSNLVVLAEDAPVSVLVFGCRATSTVSICERLGVLLQCTRLCTLPVPGWRMLVFNKMPYAHFSTKLKKGGREHNGGSSRQTNQNRPQVHFGHTLCRSAINDAPFPFPGGACSPSLRSRCPRGRCASRAPSCRPGS